MKVFILILSLITSISIVSQGAGGKSGVATFSGKVIDESTKKAMEYVTVALFSTKDSSLVTGAITDGVGEFKLTGIALGKYYARFSFIGYKNKIINEIEFSPSKREIDLNKVVLAPDQELLEDVTVVADKPAVVYEIDKKVVNVENMTTVASATAIEVLENIPSISVDIDGNISLRGSTGFTLLIDNKPSPMQASEALQLIPASNIKDIEIITNPSAKYNAEGTSGIINVLLKKNKLEGISTLVNLNGGNFNNYAGDFLVSINKKKVKFNVGANFRNANRFRDIIQERQIVFNEGTSEVNSEGLHRFFRTNYGLNTALEWTPNRKSSFSFGLVANQRQYNAAANYNFEEFTNDVLINEYTNKERTLRQFYGGTLSGGYQYLIGGDKSHRLNINAMFNYNDGNEDALTESFDANEVLQEGNNSTEVGPSQLFRVEVDYVKPLKNKAKFKVGARADFANNSDEQNSFEYDSTVNEFVRLPLFSSNVSYLQNIYAGYAIYSGFLKEKLGYQLGIRSEYTDRDISIETGNINTLIQRLDFFPSAHFSYQLSKKNQLKASVSRRIQRPRSWYLEPFVFWEDPYTTRQGNPDLLPEYIQSYELGWVSNLKKGSFSAELYHRNTVNTIERIQEPFDTNVILKRPINAGTSTSSGLELSYQKRVNKWWKVNFGGNLFFYTINGVINDIAFDREALTYKLRFANTFSLVNDWSVQLVSNYNSPRATAQGRTNGFYDLDFSVKNDFWQNKVTASFQFRNVLNSIRKETFIESQTLNTYRLAVPRWPVFTFALAFRLNNFQNKDKIKTVKGDSF